MKLTNLFNEVYTTVKAAPGAFLAVFFATVLITYSVLYVIDFIHEPITDTDESDSEIAVVDFEATPDEEEVSDVAVDSTPEIAEPVVANPLPEKIVFDELNREIDILNPTSRSIADLDEALLEGVVRHPDSATFAETGNIFILGHSSYLPNVLNKNFQAFNGIQELNWGDTIRLQSADIEYVYRVDKVYEAKASEVVVPIDNTRDRLTLATCDSFGSTDDRFIVEATLVQSLPLGETS